MTFADILDMVVEQEGRCAYSGVAMEMLMPNSHWRMSLERRTNTEGYSRNNCALIAAEFNTSDYSRHPGVDLAEVGGTAQWSEAKFRSVFELRLFAMDLCQLAKDIRDARIKQPSSRLPVTSWPRSPNAAGEWSCCSCGLQKYPSEFYKNHRQTGDLHSYCKACAKERYRRRGKTFRGNAQRLLVQARRRSRFRGQAFALDLDDMLQMLWLQKGRCFYSGIPLQYKQQHTDWRMSLERLDNSIGYIRSNCVLIAVEFNTSDHSRNIARTTVFGTAQWSRAKVAHVWGHPGAQSLSAYLCDARVPAGQPLPEN
ncbi:unnamed protein product, partial [Polarella glacialis]